MSASIPATSVGRVHPPSVGTTPPVLPRARSSRWLRILLIVLAGCVLFDYGLSLLLEHGWLNLYFTKHLEAAFGRPVEVSHYSFSLLEGPRLEANYITVAEDPRFGDEYFLRADQLAVGLRWSALLRGRLQLGSLSFTRPSLNLVRLPDGEWNLESWLPHPPGHLAAARPDEASLRIAGIAISDGRVNFKQGPDKLPFAFVGAKGSVDQIAPGSWKIEVQARPFRAAVNLQQAGVLRLTGLVGGTSSRLRPASLRLDWSDASLSDILRLASGYDYGARGLLALQLTAQSVGSDWNLSSQVQLRQLHGWDLPLQPDDPTANLRFRVHWIPRRSRFDLTDAVLETPDSNFHARGALELTKTPHSTRPSMKHASFEIRSSNVELGDLLTWYRAFHTGVADQLALHGRAQLRLDLSGWPPRIEKGTLISEPMELTGGSLPVPIHADHWALYASRDALSFPPARFLLGAKSGVLQLQWSGRRRAKWESSWRVEGRTDEVKTLTAAAAALGHGLPEGWSFHGPAQFRLEWKGNPGPRFLEPEGTIASTGLAVHFPFLNQEITKIDGTMTLSSRGTKIDLTGADAFAGTWRGTLERSRSDPGWHFRLAAESLSAADMNRWLNPRQRESLLDRVFPFLVSPVRPVSVPHWLRGEGTIAVKEFTLSPLRLRQLQTDASIAGRRIALRGAQALLAGGKVQGSMDLDLSAIPSYQIRAAFQSVDLGRLAARTSSLGSLFAGTASGQLSLAAKGMDREALLHSMTCRGSALARQAEYRGIDLAASIDAGQRRSGVTISPAASANFSCANGQIRFTRLQLLGASPAIEASGSVSFQEKVGFELWPEKKGDGLQPVSADSGPRGAFELAGDLKAPLFSRAPKRARKP